jgi:flagellin-like protein
MGKMKANRKFVEGKEAVSAVIGVILMVAITVAIAATVFVYVSGMMTPTTTGKIMSASPVGSADTTNMAMQFKVTSVDPGVDWQLCTLAWANGTGSGTAADKNITSDALGVTPMAGNIAVGQYFYLQINDRGTFAVDLIFGGKIIWTSASFVI